MSSQGGPSFFCSRPDGSLTPLIALDDLPAGVNVRGVNRTLKPADTQGMISCGSTEPRAEPWTLEGNAVALPGAIANDAELHDVLLKIVAETSVAPHLRQAVKGILCRDLANPRATGAAAHGNTNNNAGRNAGHGHGAHANGKHGFHAKKEYCSYWIRHGECDYAQQGCMFKHQMPTDLEMLERLGLRDIPRWYREQHGVPSLLANNGNHRGHLPAIDDSPKFRAVAPNGTTAGPAGPAGFVGPSGQTGPSGQAGPSGHANGYTNSNASNKNRNGNQHGHGQGHSNNNNNGTHNGHGHPRGGRYYKSPRGAGFAAGKTRGTGTWNKAIVHDSVTPPPEDNGKTASGTPSSRTSDLSGVSIRTGAKNDMMANPMVPSLAEDNGKTASGTPSSRTSDLSGVSIRTGAKNDMMANPMVPPLAEAEKASQHIMDQDDMPSDFKTMAERLSDLTTEENVGGPALSYKAGPYKDSDYPDLSRKVSRRLYAYGLDGDKTKGAVKTKGTGFDPFAGLSKLETGNKAEASTAATPIDQLVAGSDPIDPKERLFNWGPIGKPVRRPLNLTDEFLAFLKYSSKTRNAFAPEFYQPDVRRH